jgi:D-alanyl-D-alanine-carboxypeptidase/D-alanyl-D-alanine-endopeptidase
MSKRFKVCVYAMLVFTLPVSCGRAGALETPANESTPTCTDLIPEITKSEVRAQVNYGNNVGLVVGVVAPCGREIYAYGYSDLSKSKAVGENTVFELGSIGKVFTTILLADMVQRGEISLDDPIEKYLPADVATPTFNGKSITLVDLATQTSGLPLIPDNLAPADEYNPYADYTVEQMYDELAHTHLTHDIGSEYEYSNFGMGVLGHILSLRSGMSYEDLVITRITDVLGMPNTRETLTPEMWAHLATGYDGKEVFPLWDNPTLAGAGALRSTADDMLTFLAANLGLQPSPLYDAMLATQEPHFQIDETTEIGLGWQIQTKGNAQIIWHNGATGGYWCFAGLVRDKQMGAVILTNSFQDISYMGLSLLRTAPTNTTQPSP